MLMLVRLVGRCLTAVLLSRLFGGGGVPMDSVLFSHGGHRLVRCAACRVLVRRVYLISEWFSEFYLLILECFFLTR